MKKFWSKTVDGKENVIVGFSKVGSIGVGLITVSAYGAAQGAGVNLGLSDGGIEVGHNTKALDIRADNVLGVLDQFKTEEDLVLKCNIIEASLANMVMAMGYPSTAYAAGTAAVGGDWTVPKYTIYISVNGVQGGVRTFKFYNCTIMGDVKNAYKKNEKTMIPITITVLQDLTQTAGAQLFTVTDSSLDTTPPTVAMTTPASGGTVTKNTSGTLLLTVMEANNIDQSTLKYGASVQVLDITTQNAPTLVAGAIVYDPTAKTITFTPSGTWTASHDYMVVISTQMKDLAGNALASTYIGVFTATS